MHSLTSCFVLGYHGCDRRVAERLVLREAQFRKSENSYDWLGHGIYFWLENPRRACEWARRRAKPGKFEPAVVGAVIDLRNCLDLTTTAGIDFVKAGYAFLTELYKLQERELPENSKSHDGDHDRLIRRLDCAVINMTCDILEKSGIHVDTVKGMFTEGGEAFPGACIYEHTHTQICVRNLDCIKGVFFPPRESLGNDAGECNNTRY